jgi:CheY-like chemotaxis protein
MRSPKIFIVDDDRAIIRLYKMILGQKGFNNVVFAHNGREAIEKYEKFRKKPQIIIMDHRMPILNGIDAMKHILKMNKGPKIIFASADSSVRKRAISQGAYDFLNKPFDIDDLLKTIKTALNNGLEN